MPDPGSVEIKAQEGTPLHAAVAQGWWRRDPCAVVLDVGGVLVPLRWERIVSEESGSIRVTLREVVARTMAQS